eukprot:TRINITY_DN1279_c0_g2_i1.p1 TRINITY_DN1279_c0_g2~~TRINITY_DN1279_c0_g2_i1.p1  ORF type:complete len:1032 (-),score=389.88 TRINITY_DN1279_c0_g2_i1:85-3180(-)
MSIPFAHSPEEFHDMMRYRNKESLEKLGGVVGVCQALHTDHKTGIAQHEEKDNYADRKNHFGVNVFPKPPMTGFWTFWLNAMSDTTLIILMAAAVVSLGMGLFIGGGSSEAYPVCGADAETIKKEKNLDWIEGTAILCVVAVVSMVGAGNDYSKELKFRALADEEKNIQIKTIRGGHHHMISIFDLCVGDIVSLDTGDQIPADGLFLTGYDVACDESQLTGESMPVKKSAENPFMLSGCKITDGSCSMVLTGVGIHSEWGNIVANLGDKPRPTPLQDRLDELAGSIGKFGTYTAVIIFLALVAYWLYPALTSKDVYNLTQKCIVPTDSSYSEGSGDVYGSYDWTQAKKLVEFFIIAVTIIVVAVPEGLPLAVTIALAYSMKQMLKEQNLVRHLKACETMSNCTNICSDKTGTLTENRMTVVRGWVSGNAFEGQPSKRNFDERVLALIADGIALNTTPSSNASFDGVTKQYEVIGNKTEGALLIFLSAMDVDYRKIREDGQERIFQRFPFSSKNKRMTTVVKIPEKKKLRVFTKGAPEILLENCTSLLGANGLEPMSPEKKKALNTYIEESASRGFRTIGLAVRDMGFPKGEDGGLTSGSIPQFTEAPDNDMTLCAIFGIEDPLRPEVPQAVQDCQTAGITVRMVTGDNIMTAKKIAMDCGILTSSEEMIAMEGPAFAQLTDEQLNAILPKLRVLARSAPSDKQRLVKRLIENGEVVAVTGDGTNDVPALKEADVGLAMGIRGTDIAKQAADIVIMDDNFQSIVTAVKWGRNVFDNIRKFLQFQLTVNVAALAIVVIGAIGQRGAPLKAVQLLWVNMIMDTLAALALGTEKPTKELLLRKPCGRFDSLISPYMLRFIIGNAVFQIGVLLALLYGGSRIPFLNVPCAYVKSESTTDMCTSEMIDQHTLELQSLIFNTFVLCQVFNQINARRVNGERSFYRGLFTNATYLIVFLFIGGMQVAIMIFAGKTFTVVPFPGINKNLWIASVGIAAIEIPLGFLISFMPTCGSTGSTVSVDLIKSKSDKYAELDVEDE